MAKKKETKKKNPKGFQKGNTLWKQGLAVREAVKARENEALITLHAGLWEEYLAVHERVLYSKTTLPAAEGMPEQEVEYILTRRDTVILKLVEEMRPYIFAKRATITGEGKDADNTINITITRDYGDKPSV